MKHLKGRKCQKASYPCNLKYGLQQSMLYKVQFQKYLDALLAELLMALRSLSDFCVAKSLIDNPYLLIWDFFSKTVPFMQGTKFT